ncbi:MAG: LAGLIDADG family homing endonuclease [Candidatus Omnitrophica bacterium]|nr:LAGLIDADG family homing endonuclease [Candidatus Omnitrophota bacterium]MDD5592516.1 LAGLIDADG family homing endonuclease [Candidatus Omnitrophota bacterium]
MHLLERTNRFKRIERRFDSPIEDLLYQMHWLEDMKHRDIALNLHAPRATITRWFRRLQVPTQSCRRFTDMNLTSWLYKIGKLKKKPRYSGPDKRLQRTRQGLNVDFFKKWSVEMAYVLGYFAADGCMFINPRGSKYISFTSCDREILQKVKRMLGSEHKFSVKNRQNRNWKDAFTLQIGSKEMYQDLIKKGFMPKKASRFKLPAVPKKYMRHFIRGYFDGDGSVTYGYFKRKDRNNKMTSYLLTCLSSANLRFLRGISKVLKENIGINGGYIDKKGGHLAYSKLDSIKLFQYIYTNVNKGQYLERKYKKFRKAFEINRGCGLV